MKIKSKKIFILREKIQITETINKINQFMGFIWGIDER